MIHATTPAPPLLHRLAERYRYGGWGNAIAIGLSILSLVAIGITYTAMSEGPLHISDPRRLAWLVFADIALVLLLLIVVAERLLTLWLNRRSNRAGSRLQLRLVVIMSLLAGLPAIMMAFFSIIFFQVGVQSWFSERVSTTVRRSIDVAETYLQEHQESLRADALAMAQILNRGQYGGAPVQNREQLAELVGGLANLVGDVSEVLVINRDGEPITRYGFYLFIESQPPSAEQFAQADAQGVVLVPTEEQDRVRALVPLRYPGLYLYVGRTVDPAVRAYVEEVRETALEYGALEARRSGLQITVSLLFGVVAALFLAMAITGGLWVAGWFGRPVSQLIGAAERLRAGDLAARVPLSERQDEIGNLMRSFNRMAEQLNAQQAALLAASAQIDARRRFTEAVLEGVSAGVLGLDRQGNILLANDSAVHLLGRRPGALIGTDVRAFMPGLADDLPRALVAAGSVETRQIDVLDHRRRRRTLLLRMVGQGQSMDECRLVMTFDDITELLTAQRHAAWAGVARRIAHEIKNPLTPVQLSAERLRRRFARQITEDPETYQLCIDTILRQVDTMRRLVDEFSAFARMPQPQLKPEDLARLLDQQVFAQRQAGPGITVEWQRPPAPVPVLADSQLMGSAILNLMQNAAQALGEQDPERRAAHPPVITVTLRHDEDQAVVEIADNGPGVPPELRDRVMDPYVTTREKGTGLGLAIVKKVVEDHGGAFDLLHPEAGGVIARFTLPAGGGIEATQRQGHVSDTVS